MLAGGKHNLGEELMADWKAIETEYITTNTSYRKLADKYGIDQATISRKAKKEDWVSKRQHHISETQAKILTADVEGKVNRVAKLIGVSDLLLDRVKSLVEDHPEFLMNTQNIYGEMTASQRAGIKGYLLNAFELCGVDREDATNKLQYWEFLGEQPDSELTQYQIADYYEFAKPAGISADLYTDYCRMVKNISGEGKKERRMAVIDSLPISNAQKDALYYAEGWAESKLYQAPWH